MNPVTKALIVLASIAACFLMMVLLFVLWDIGARVDELSDFKSAGFDDDRPEAKAFMTGLLSQCEALAIPESADPTVAVEQARINLWSRLLDIRAHTGSVEDGVTAMRTSCERLHAKIEDYEDLSETIGHLRSDLISVRESIAGIVAEIDVCGDDETCREDGKRIGALIASHVVGAEAKLSRLEGILNGDDGSSAIGRLLTTTTSLETSVQNANSGLSATTNLASNLLQRLEFATDRLQIGAIEAERQNDGLQLSFGLEGDTPPECSELTVFVALEGDGIVSSPRVGQAFRVTAEEDSRTGKCSSFFRILTEELETLELDAEPGRVADVFVVRSDSLHTPTIEAETP